MWIVSITRKPHTITIRNIVTLYNKHMHVHMSLGSDVKYIFIDTRDRQQMCDLLSKQIYICIWKLKALLCTYTHTHTNWLLNTHKNITSSISFLFCYALYNMGKVSEIETSVFNLTIKMIIITMWCWRCDRNTCGLNRFGCSDALDS